jgi:AcrR family transcriptional regulator
MGDADDARASAGSAAYLSRKPTQKRSQARVEALLHAADQLLRERGLHEVGMHEIALAANATPSSAYHYFATREALFLRLAERYLVELRTVLDAPIDLASIERWPDYIALMNARTVAFFNDRPAARRLMLGSAVGSEVRNLDYEDIEGTARRGYDDMNRVFVMPYVREPELKFRVLIGIYDGVWASSFAKHGYITPSFAREALAAGVAYLSTLLPPAIPLRDPESDTGPSP